MYIPECGLYANGSPHNADDGDANECESELVLEMSPWYIRTYSIGSNLKIKYRKLVFKWYGRLMWIM